MEAAWWIGKPAASRVLHAAISKAHPVEQITAVTVLNRLVAKGLLQREKIDDVFHYSPTLSQDSFMQQASRHVVERVLALGTEAVSASLVDVLSERDPDQLAELGRLIRRKLRERDDR